jgi:hypothetical protein
VVIERREGQQGTDVDECGTIEQQIDNVGEYSVFRLLIEVATARSATSLHPSWSMAGLR